VSTLRTIRVFRILALSIGAAAIAQADSVDVTANVTMAGSMFQYDYTIVNGSGEDLPVLTIDVTPGITVSNLSAPGGPSAFETAYDSVLGAVSFLENAATFRSMPESGFIFDSPVGPGTTMFAAALQNLSAFEVTTDFGTTKGPIATPEPSSLAPVNCVGVALLFWRKRSLASRPQ
jgi:hypothetical protein